MREGVEALTLSSRLEQAAQHPEGDLLGLGELSGGGQALGARKVGAWIPRDAQEIEGAAGVRSVTYSMSSGLVAVPGSLVPAGGNGHELPPAPTWSVALDSSACPCEFAS